MVASQVAAQKFFQCSSTTVRPLGLLGATSMKVMDTVWPCEGKLNRSGVNGYSEALKLRAVGAWLIGPSRSHECGGEYEKDPYTHRQIAAYPRIHRIDLFS